MATFDDDTNPVALESLDGILDSAQFGNANPLYTWRKGGTANQSDNHLYLILGGAQDEVKIGENVLIEIIPETKEVKFYGKTTLNGTVELDQGNIDASSLAKGSITSDLLEPDIAIQGSVERLTTPRSLDGILFDGSSDITRFSICQTKSETSTKEIIVTGFDGKEGATISVLFENAPTTDTISFLIHSENTVKSNFPVKYANNEGNLVDLDGSTLIANRIYTFIVHEENLVLTNELDDKASAVLIQFLYESMGKVYQYDKSNDNIEYPLTLKIGNNTLSATLEKNAFVLDVGEEHGLDTGVWAENSETILDSIGFGEATYNPQLDRITVTQIKSKATGLTTDFYQGLGTAVFVNGSGIQSGLVSYQANKGVFSIIGNYSEEKIKIVYTSSEDFENTKPTHEITLIDKDGETTLETLNVSKRIHGEIDRADQDISGNPIETTYLKVADAEAHYARLNNPNFFSAEVHVPKVTTEENTFVSTVGYVDSIRDELSASISDKTNSTLEKLESEVKALNDTILNKTINVENNFVLTQEQKNALLKQLGLENIGFDYILIDGGDEKYSNVEE